MDPATALTIASTSCKVLAQAITVFEALYQYIKEVRDAPAKSRELQREAFAVVDLLQCAAQALEGRTIASEQTSRKQWTCFATEFADTMKEMSELIEVRKGENWKRLKWPFDSKENQKYLEKLGRFKATFTLALQTIQRYGTCVQRF